jgi:3-polyprenyl-4-hydroxybenzoate decarboxylase
MTADRCREPRRAQGRPQRRKLVLAVRETPFCPIHLRDMLTLSDVGATIIPPAPAFYNWPVDLADAADQTVSGFLTSLASNSAGLQVERHGGLCPTKGDLQLP